MDAKSNSPFANSLCKNLNFKNNCKGANTLIINYPQKSLCKNPFAKNRN